MSFTQPFFTIGKQEEVVVSFLNINMVWNKLLLINNRFHENDNMYRLWFFVLKCCYKYIAWRSKFWSRSEYSNPL